MFNIEGEWRGGFVLAMQPPIEDEDGDVADFETPCETTMKRYQEYKMNNCFLFKFYRHYELWLYIFFL